MRQVRVVNQTAFIVLNISSHWSCHSDSTDAAFTRGLKNGYISLYEWYFIFKRPYECRIYNMIYNLMPSLWRNLIHGKKSYVVVHYPDKLLDHSSVVDTAITDYREETIFFVKLKNGPIVWFCTSTIWFWPQFQLDQKPPLLFVWSWVSFVAPCFVLGQKNVFV